jgi:hypothetical protein
MININISDARTTDLIHATGCKHRSLKKIITVLARAIRNLTDRPALASLMLTFRVQQVVGRKAEVIMEVTEVAMAGGFTAGGKRGTRVASRCSWL